MNKFTKILSDNRPIVMFMIDIILILILYLILYHYYDESSNPRDVIFDTFTMYICSKFTLNLLYMTTFPPKCILDSDNRSCRF